VAPNPACLGDTITFTASGVVDTGGIKRVDCSAKTQVPAVSPTYTWELTIPGGYPDPLPPLSGSGPAASVVAKVPGTYSATFTATAGRDCPPAPRVIGPGSMDPCSGGGVCPFDLTIERITFVFDHPTYEDAPPCRASDPSSCWGAGEAYTGAAWRSEDNPDQPVCYTRGSALEMQVYLRITASQAGTVTLKVTGPPGISGTRDIAFPCGETYLTVNVSTPALPNGVRFYEPMWLAWSAKWPEQSGFTAVRQTPHDLYVTYDTPAGGSPTRTRMRWLCVAGYSESTEIGVTDRIHAVLGDPLQPPRDGHDPEQSDDWELMSEEGTSPPDDVQYWAECDEQARFMNRGIQLVGVPAGTPYFTYASTDTDPTDEETTTAGQLGITQDLDGDTVIGNETLRLVFDFDPPYAYINNFEGSLHAAGKYYAVWPNMLANSACELLSVEISQIRTREGGNTAIQVWYYSPTGYIHSPAVPFPACP